MKKILILITILSGIFSTQIMSQQIGDGYSTRIPAFNVPLLSGLYEIFQDHPTELPEVGWMHLFTIRHSNLMNNHQLQITSSYAENDKLYFRKIASYDLQDKSTPWHELATRGNNLFNGEQRINGSVLLSQNSAYCIGEYTSGHRLVLHSAYWNENSHGAIIDYYDNLMIRVGENSSTLKNVMSFSPNGDVAIGVSSSNSLSVNGMIRAKEVKIENTNWPDYVFSKTYKLPSLNEVARHIEENRHLPGIPSAEEVSKEGVNISDMQAKLLQKIEELTLYMIQQQKEIESLKKELKDNKVQK